MGWPPLSILREGKCPAVDSLFKGRMHVHICSVCVSACTCLSPPLNLSPTPAPVSLSVLICPSLHLSVSVYLPITLSGPVSHSLYLCFTTPLSTDQKTNLTIVTPPATARHSPSSAPARKTPQLPAPCLRLRSRVCARARAHARVGQGGKGASGRKGGGARVLCLVHCWVLS